MLIKLKYNLIALLNYFKEIVVTMKVLKNIIPLIILLFVFGNSQTYHNVRVSQDGLSITVQYDMNGRLVETLVGEYFSDGHHDIRWNAYNQSSGEILLESNIEIYTEADEKIFAEQAYVNTNGKIITLKKNVKYQNSNIFVSSDESIINNEYSNIKYYGNVKSKVLKNKSYE